MREISRLALLLLLVLSVVMGVSAQSKNATVTTTVLDPNKAVLRCASVTLTNVETKAFQKRVSNDKGECKLEAPAGAYELTTDLYMFCPLRVSDLRLKEDETVPVELKLEPVKWTDPGPEYEKLMKSLGF